MNANLDQVAQAETPLLAEKEAEIRVLQQNKLVLNAEREKILRDMSELQKENSRLQNQLAIRQSSITVGKFESKS